jgi:hypothetical protein
MRKLLAWGIAGVVFAGLAVASGRAGDDDDDNYQQKPAPRPFIRWSPYFAGMNAAAPSKPDPVKAADRSKKETVKKSADNSKAKAVVDETAALRAREETTLMRRLEICDKLKEIALRTNDNDLFRKAEVLDEQARAAYTQRTASARAGRFESDEKSVDNYLGSSRPLKSRASEGSAHTVTANDRAGSAESREEER